MESRGLETRTVRLASLRYTWDALPRVQAGKWPGPAKGKVQNGEATASWGAHIEESGSAQDDHAVFMEDEMVSAGLGEGRIAPSLLLPGSKEIRPP